MFYRFVSSNFRRAHLIYYASPLLSQFNVLNNMQFHRILTVMIMSELSSNRIGKFLFTGIFNSVLILSFVAGVFGQEEVKPAVQPTPPEEPIRISTEEVHLNVTAQGASGRFVPNLTAQDLLIVEEGDPQTITSMKKVPASVLLLLDTGSDLNFAKRISTTRLVAKLFVAGLAREDTLAVMQYYNKVERLSDWTNDFEAVGTILDRKLFSSKWTRFSDALNAAVEMFKSRPLENRHLVLISDGLDNVADAETRRQAIQKVIAANITVHVLSYTGLEEQAAQKASQRFKLGDGKTRPRIDPMVWDTIVKGVPGPIGASGAAAVKMADEIREHLRMLNESQAMVIFDLDRERAKLISQKRDEWHESQLRLQTLAEDTGGLFQAPENTETLFRLALQTANAIDSNYVVTYVPTKTIAGAKGTEPRRKVRVSSHLNGVYIRSRQTVFWNPAASGQNDVK